MFWFLLIIVGVSLLVTLVLVIQVVVAIIAGTKSRK